MSWFSPVIAFVSNVPLYISTGHHAQANCHPLLISKSPTVALHIAILYYWSAPTIELNTHATNKQKQHRNKQYSRSYKIEKMVIYVHIFMFWADLPFGNISLPAMSFDYV